VYLTGGVLLVGSMEESMGFWGATALCILVCWLTKLISCSMQQKLFGENMSENVSVRYAVGINSLQMRAIRYCLMQPGLSPAKVAILCGGPDWPTSVLCGILRVPLHEALIGTSPVLVLYLAYTALAGAFTLKTGGECASDATSRSARRGRPLPAPAGAVPPPPAAFEEPGEDQLLADGLRGGAGRGDGEHVVHVVRGGVLHGGHHREQAQGVRRVPGGRGGGGEGEEGGGEAGGVQEGHQVDPPTRPGPYVPRRGRRPHDRLGARSPGTSGAGASPPSPSRAR
jgi:hypothetical protein